MCIYTQKHTQESTNREQNLVQFVIMFHPPTYPSIHLSIDPSLYAYVLYSLLTSIHINLFYQSVLAKETYKVITQIVRKMEEYCHENLRKEEFQGVGRS